MSFKTQGVKKKKKKINSEDHDSEWEMEERGKFRNLDDRTA